MFHVKHEKFVTIRLCGSDFGEMFHVKQKNFVAIQLHNSTFRSMFHVKHQETLVNSAVQLRFRQKCFTWNILEQNQVFVFKLKSSLKHMMFHVKHFLFAPNHCALNSR